MIKSITINGKYARAHVWKNTLIKTDKTLIPLINQKYLQGGKVNIFGNGLTIQFKDKIAPSILVSDICQHTLIRCFSKKEFDMSRFSPNNASIQDYEFNHEGRLAQYQLEHISAVEELVSIRCPLADDEHHSLDHIINNSTIMLYKDLEMKYYPHEYFLVIKLDI